MSALRRAVRAHGLPMTEPSRAVSAHGLPVSAPRQAMREGIRP